MKNLTEPELDRRRDRSAETVAYYGSVGDHANGVFRFVHKGHRLMVLASTGDGWEHVSASFANRCPTWEEMCWVKQRFFYDHEVVMQLHVPAAENVSWHDYTLHLWKPIGQDIPRPPSILVGIKR